MVTQKQRRISTLVELLAERRVIHIKDAAGLLGVSEMTVRRDLADHAHLFGYLGGHIVPRRDGDVDAPYELSIAADSHAVAKRNACQQALRHVRPDETVFIDCGTTLTHLVDLIPDGIPLTVVCYSLNIAEKIAKRPNLSLVLLGGLYHPASATFFGDAGIETLAELGINVAFLSAAGLDLERGASCAHFHEAQIKRKVIAMAQRRILVTDSSKIGKLRPAFFGEIGAFDEIITETGPLDLA